jgi:hypothetical protein
MEAAGAAQKRAQRKTSDCMLKATRKKSYLLQRTGRVVSIYIQDAMRHGERKPIIGNLNGLGTGLYDQCHPQGSHPRHIQERWWCVATQNREGKVEFNFSFLDSVVSSKLPVRY